MQKPARLLAGVMRKVYQSIKVFMKFIKYLHTNYDRVSPFPFIVWFSVSFVVWLASLLGFSVEFIFANATYLNVQYGSVICTFIMLISCILLPCRKIKKMHFFRAHALSKIFSDTAMGASGFIIFAGIYNENFIPAGLLFAGLIVYVLVGNHIFHSIFNENIGSRKFFREVDKKSNTRIGTGKIERNIEKTVLATAAFIVFLVGSGLSYVLSMIYA